MLSLLRRWILPSSSSFSASGFFSPHYIPAISLSSHRISHFSTSPPLHSDNKPTKPSKPSPPPASPSVSTPSSTAPPVSPPADNTLKPVVTPAWNELISIL